MAVCDINNLHKQYDLIYADPPWKQKRGGGESLSDRTRQDASLIIR